MEENKNNDLTRAERIQRMKLGFSYIIIEKPGQNQGEAPLEVPPGNAYTVDELTVVPEEGESIFIKLDDEIEPYISKREVIIEDRVKIIPYKRPEPEPSSMLSKEGLAEITTKVHKAYGSKRMVVPLAIIATVLLGGMVATIVNSVRAQQSEEPEPVVKVVEPMKSSIVLTEDDKDLLKTIKMPEDVEMEGYTPKVVEEIDINGESYAIVGLNSLKNSQLDEAKIAIMSQAGDMIYETDAVASVKIAEDRGDMEPFRNIQLVSYDEGVLAMVELMCRSAVDGEIYIRVIGFRIDNEGLSGKVFDRSASEMTVSIKENRFYVEGTEMEPIYLSLKGNKVKIERNES